MKGPPQAGDLIHLSRCIGTLPPSKVNLPLFKAIRALITRLFPDLRWQGKNHEATGDISKAEDNEDIDLFASDEEEDEEVTKRPKANIRSIKKNGLLWGRSQLITIGYDQKAAN
ncbi:hypothetical protein DL764_009481 [Monosporascus ibericus]|uniref:Uncharacterized protein n=1 Tax=Monosporascus ibericus TaxID=155417 RepID=A0A4Q4SXS4_9PEZI|nr:hypothetical protein DL764_009481 [Monosporascus ibericus]